MIDSNKPEVNESTDDGKHTCALDPEKEKVLPILKFFAYKHLPNHLKKISEPFSSLAYEIAEILPTNPETATALRKLLEAKDCAVRACL